MAGRKEIGTLSTRIGLNTVVSLPDDGCRLHSPKRRVFYQGYTMDNVQKVCHFKTKSVIPQETQHPIANRGRAVQQTGVKAWDAHLTVHGLENGAGKGGGTYSGHWEFLL
jgi:hypothetical protein